MPAKIDTLAEEFTARSAAADLGPFSDQCRSTSIRWRAAAHIATVYQQPKLFGVGPLWVANTMNTGWIRWQHETRMELLRGTGSSWLAFVAFF